MQGQLKRREFMQAAMACGAVCAGCAARKGMMAGGLAATTGATVPDLVSPGCRSSKLKVAKLYLANTQPMWPHPKMDLNAEVQEYEKEFARMQKGELADVEFVGNTLVTSVEQLAALKPQIQDADAVLAIHVAWSVAPILNEIMGMAKPTAVFAAPYSGHDWTSFGTWRRAKDGALIDFYLTSDYEQLAVALRPFRAMHHLREARILDASGVTRWKDYMTAVTAKFGTQHAYLGRDRVMEAYNAVDEARAAAEATHWTKQAEAVVEPPPDEVLRSCRLALAFEDLLSQEKATVLTVDCYGSMYHQLPAFPCVGFTRLNDMGLAGICESDLTSAMTYILLQGLCGKPGFISDPTVDESNNTIILAHCLGTLKMDGPGGPTAPYRLRTIMERQEGCVPQVRMRVGQKVTQAQLVEPDLLLYFTGTIVDVPRTERGCRTQITVKVDGDVERLWKNWTYRLHRTTVYGDVVKDLRRFCRYTGVRMVNEAEECPVA